jgi:hypothetical protein
MRRLPNEQITWIQFEHGRQPAKRCEPDVLSTMFELAQASRCDSGGCRSLLLSRSTADPCLSEEAAVDPKLGLGRHAESGQTLSGVATTIAL